MGPTYAGILGPVAFLATLARGMAHGGGLVQIVPRAAAALFGFAALGYVVGRLAGWIVEESVQSEFAAELSAQDATGIAASLAASAATRKA